MRFDGDSTSGNHQAFEQLANLRQQLLATIPNLSAQVFDTLSMGMSDDLEQAIAAGSTMVRVGTAILVNGCPKF